MLPALPSHAADTITPKITGARMADADGDDRADRVVLTYSEKINHALDTDGTYPFAVGNYKVTKVGGASAARTLIVFIKEKVNPDIAAHPTVKYTRTTRKPVRDLAKNQARNQSFANTLMLDKDGDGHAQGDCAPTDAAIHPSQTDHPDESYADVNCDGIDGETDNAVFVSTAGADVGGCGALASPCATPDHGINQAGSSGKRDVYVQAGTYNNSAFFMTSGINVYGGFDSTWQRTAAAETRVVGTSNFQVIPGEFQSATVVADSLTMPTTLADMVLEGADGADPGDNSYTLIVRNSAGNLTVTRNTFIAGNGAAGAVGTNGQNATAVDRAGFMNGGNGGDANEVTTACDNSSHGGGGPAGTNSGPGTSMNGGSGGAGGEMDTDCSCCSYNFDARSGDPGGNAGTNVPPNFGIGGAGGQGSEASCLTLGNGVDGRPGRISNGAAGTSGSGGSIVGLWFRAGAGTAGGVGQNGGGGGGGGGSGGCDAGTDAWGAGGGGGGAGGLAAQSGGGGGGGGGSSIAIYLINSSPTITNNEIERGTGGTGGAGGTGGRGQSGGLGGLPGLPDDTGTAGDGGNGGHGDHGGGGGGGAGGSSIGVLSTSNASVPVLSGNTFSGGAAGGGGAGGASAPTALVAERDGSPGPAGVAGVVDDVDTCFSASNC